MDRSSTGNMDVGPHQFTPLRWRDRILSDGDCASCFVTKSRHPVRRWVPARPLGYRTKQRTFIYCPACGWEMVAGGRWLGQEITSIAEGYECARCGHVSVWDFEAPVPILLRGAIDREAE